MMIESTFKKNKFRRSSKDLLSFQRDHVLENGTLIIFMLGGVDLTLLQADNRKVDFDALSDKEIAKLDNVKNTPQITFIWHNNAGFVRM